MIPLGVRGDGFCVPADPYAYDLVPTLDVAIVADGQREPITAVLGFPVSFEPRDDGAEGFRYKFIPMIIRDDVDVTEIDGMPASIEAELFVRDGPPLALSLDGVLVISE
jgi:hypothetical protein